MTDKPETDKQALLQKIFEESRHRPVIPFIGSGVSISAGYPAIRLVIQYLAKVDFAIRFGVFQDRFPLVKEGKDGQEKQVEIYRQHPSKYLEDFGWPNLGQLDADLWSWLERDTRFDMLDVKGEGRYKIWKESLLSRYIKVHNFSKNLLDIINTIMNIIETDISGKIQDGPFQYIMETLQRDSIALKGKSLISQWPFWKPLLDKELPSEKKNISEYQDLKAVENDSIAYEDTLRMTTKTSEEDALHRSSSFALRARALYLQGHFSQAHHFLDIASTGLLLERIDHRVNASIIHLVRAELLSTSAHEHYPPQDNNTNNKINIPKLMNEANTSLKKIKRAEEELLQAEELLHDLAHENSWKIALEFGWAQVQLEKMLFDLEILFLEGDKKLNETEYLKKSGALEQSILAGMRRLRNVLDMVPYSPDDWEIEEKKITYDHSIQVEKFSVEDKLESRVSEFIDQKGSEIKINKLKQFRILIVNLRKLSEKEDEWTIAGFNDEEKFKNELIKDSNNELLTELKNDTYFKSKIVDLATSQLGRTLPDNSPIELLKQLEKKSFDKCKIVDLVLAELNIGLTQQVNKKNYPTLVKIERMSYMLWKQFFVVGAYFTGLLSNQYSGTIPINSKTILKTNSDVIPCLSGAAITGLGADQYRERWKLWCNSM